MLTTIKGYKGKGEFEVLQEKAYGFNTKLYLVRVSDNFYEYGTLREIQSLFGVPVNQCGTKGEVLAHCVSIAGLCKRHIDEFSKQHGEDSSDGWKVLIEHEQKHYEALIAFAGVLTALEDKENTDGKS